ncbi:MAG: hypothetical protein MSS47_00465, partial [Bacteroidales bacterium]|nr:hypothetical protein [Bacteroidales bacterium]
MPTISYFCGIIIIIIILSYHFIMRKLYVLLALLLCVGTAWGQTAITSLDQLSNSKVYYLKSGRSSGSTSHYLVYNTASSNGYLSSTYGSGHATTFSQTDTQFQFAIYKVGEKYFMYNLAAGKFVGNATNNNTAIPMVDLPSSNIAFKATGNATYPWMISTNNWTGAVNVADTYGCHGIVNWTGGKDNKTDEGNILQICEAGELPEATQQLIAQRISWMDYYNRVASALQSYNTNRVGSIDEASKSTLETTKSAFDADVTEDNYNAMVQAYNGISRITLAPGEKFQLRCIESSRGLLAYSTDTNKASADKPTLAGSTKAELPSLTDEGLYLDWVMIEVSGKKYIYNVEKQQFLTQGTPVTFTEAG